MFHTITKLSIKFQLFNVLTSNTTMYTVQINRNSVYNHSHHINSGTHVEHTQSLKRTQAPNLNR